MKIQRTYSSRAKTSISSLSTDQTAPLPATGKPSNKYPLQDHPDFQNTPAQKRRKTLKSSHLTSAKGKSQVRLTQLHFSIDQPILRTCPSCNLSYTKGAPDDEELHRIHCARVQKGMEWGREEEKESCKAGVVEVAMGITLKDGRQGRIISFPANVTGRIGVKISALLRTIDLALSAPPLPRDALRNSKIYLFLLPIKGTMREKIVGCAIAQRISTAMAIVRPDDISCSNNLLESSQRPLVTLDAASGLFCHPEPLPTPMGIPRMFVTAGHRRQGIASQLLTAAARTFIHGCPLNPRMGHVAFTQPTGDGNALVRSWGGRQVRIYEE